MTVTGIITAIVIGAIIGASAAGRTRAQNIPIWLTIVVGIVAAFIGTAIARAFGVPAPAASTGSRLILQVIVAAFGIYAVARLSYPTRHPVTRGQRGPAPTRPGRSHRQEMTRMVNG